MKRHQRGLLGLFELLMWVGGLAAAGVALWGAWHGFVSWVSEDRVVEAQDAQIAKDKDKVDKAEARATAAEANAAESDKRAANANTDKAKCISDAKAVTSGVNEWKVKYIALQAQVKAAAATGSKREDQQRADLKAAQAVAADQSKKVQTCEQERAAIDKFARDRLRARDAAEALKSQAGAPK